MGWQGDRQGELMVMWSEMPRSPGHVFYDRLQEVLVGAGFDGFVEDTCQAYYAKTMGAPSVPPGRYFRMHMVGYFEGIDSERGIEWRCSDSFSLREFLRLETTDRVPDHSWLSKTRGRLPHEVHETVFGWVLALIAERGLVRGERIGVGRHNPPGLQARACCGSGMLPPWRPMRPCGRSCAGIPARATARCWSGWPRKAGSRPRQRRTSSAWTGSAKAKRCRTRSGCRGLIPKRGSRA